MMSEKSSPSKETSKWTKVLKWLLFSVLLSMLPLLFDWLIAVGRSENAKLPGFPEVIGRGELCLISVTLSGVALGELFSSQKSKNSFATFIFFFTLVSFVLNSVFFTIMKSSPNDHTTSLFTIISIVSLIATIFVATSCIAVAGEDNV